MVSPTRVLPRFSDARWEEGHSWRWPRCRPASRRSRERSSSRPSFPLPASSLHLSRAMPSPYRTINPHLSSGFPFSGPSRMVSILVFIRCGNTRTSLCCLYFCFFDVWFWFVSFGEGGDGREGGPKAGAEAFEERPLCRAVLAGHWRNQE